MIGQLLGPVSQLAGTWLNGKVEEKAAQNKVKVAKAEAEAQIMLSAATSVAEWEKILAQGTQNSWKDEFITIVVMIPVILCFIPGLEDVVKNGFDRLSELPEWYTWLVFAVCSAAIGIRGGKQFMGKK